MEEDNGKEEPKAEERKEAGEATEEESVVESLEKELEEEQKPLEEEKAEEEVKEEETKGKEEAEKPSKKETKEEEEIVEERTYTIPLSKAWIMPANKRAPKAMRILKAFMIKHMKLKASLKTEGEEEEGPGALIISNEVNERMWSRGIEKPPRNIRVRAAKDKDGNVTVYLAEGD